MPERADADHVEALDDRVASGTASAAWTRLAKPSRVAPKKPSRPTSVRPVSATHSPSSSSDAQEARLVRRDGPGPACRTRRPGRAGSALRGSRQPPCACGRAPSDRSSQAPTVSIRSTPDRSMVSGSGSASISRWVLAARVIVSVPTNAEWRDFRPRRWMRLVAAMRRGQCANSNWRASAAQDRHFLAVVSAFMRQPPWRSPSQTLFVPVGANPARLFGMDARDARLPHRRATSGSRARTKRPRAATRCSPTWPLPGTRPGCGRLPSRPGRS